MQLHRLTGFAVAALLGACLTPSDTCACVLPTPVAKVVGTITLAGGGPAANAQVVGETWRPPCETVPSPPPQFAREDTVTDQHGAFRLIVWAFTEGLQCARITTRLDAAEASRIVMVRTRAETRTDHLDSVLVELTLP
jgi:hypothetical protein